MKMQERAQKKGNLPNQGDQGKHPLKKWWSGSEMKDEGEIEKEGASQGRWTSTSKGPVVSITGLRSHWRGRGGSKPTCGLIRACRGNRAQTLLESTGHAVVCVVCPRSHLTLSGQCQSRDKLRVLRGWNHLLTQAIGCKDLLSAHRDDTKLIPNPNQTDCRMSALWSRVRETTLS